MKFLTIQLNNEVSNLLHKEQKISNQTIVFSIPYLSLYSFSSKPASALIKQP